MNRTFLLSAEKVADIKTETFGIVCQGLCNGTGAIFNGAVFESCSCSKEFLRRASYVGANIPKKYWDFNLQHLTPEFSKSNEVSINVIKKYCTDIERVIEEGIGLYVQGVSGLAKTSLAFCIVKEALEHNIPSYSIRMSQLTKLLFEAINDEQKKAELDFIRDGARLLLIDEIEKDYNVADPGKFAGNLVNDFFSYIYDSQKALIVTSNIPKTDLKAVHAFNIVDRLQELIDIILVGESFRNPNTGLQKLLKGDT